MEWEDEGQFINFGGQVCCHSDLDLMSKDQVEPKMASSVEEVSDKH